MFIIKEVKDLPKTMPIAANDNGSLKLFREIWEGLEPWK